MALRDKVTEAIPQVPKEKVYSSDYPFYYKDYRDNLFCSMGEQAYNAYEPLSSRFSGAISVCQRICRRSGYDNREKRLFKAIFHIKERSLWIA